MLTSVNEMYHFGINSTYAAYVREKMDVRYALVLSYTCFLTLLEVGQAARRVDAYARARSVMKARLVTAFVKREEPGALDTTELLQLSTGESMKELRTVMDAHGTTLGRMEEEYQGIPVYDSSVTVRKDEHGHLTGDASGVLFQDIADDLPDTEPNLRDIDTLEIVIEAEKDESMRELISDVTFNRYILIDDNNKARLVNKVSYLIDGVTRPMYMIDLRSGEILQHWNSFMTLACCQKSSLKTRIFGGNKKIGKVWYGAQPYCLDFTVDTCDRCYLENKYVRVVDMKQSKNSSLNETASFPCNEFYGDEVNGAYSPAIDSFFHGTIVGKMFEEWYNSTVLDKQMIMRVHYRQNYSNAFWNGVNSTYGDGADDYYPLITMDIVGHEFGHGVVEQNSNLQYFGESGGVNEAFADIMGEVTEEFLLSSDFLTGNKVTKNSSYLREFEVPSRDNVSIGKSDKMTRDMDPHLSSGVYRRVWYVVVKEQEVEAKEAFKVFLYANKMYWHYLSTFYDVSCGLLRAAMDLGADTKPFAVAFEDVGIAKCNVSSHIYGLTNNKTQRGITVSATTQPVFAFAMPEWGKAINVEAISPTGGFVFISLHKGSWEDEEFEVAEVVATGNGKLKYNVSNSSADTNGNNTGTSGNSTNTSGNTTEISANSTDTSGNSTDTSGNSTGTSGNSSDTIGVSTGTSGNSSGTSGISTGTSGNSSDTSRNSSDTSGNSTGTSGNSTGTSGNSTGTSGNSTTSLNNTADSKPVNETDVMQPPKQEPRGIKESQFFVKLSMPESITEYSDVELTVGYICAKEFSVTDFETDAFYRYICLVQVLPGTTTNPSILPNLDFVIDIDLVWA